MKCPNCNGIGKEYRFYDGKKSVWKDSVCPTCNGTGKVEPMTNEEWIKQCNTEQLARWIVKIVDCDYCPAKQTKCKNNVPCIAQIEKWLKQPHTRE